MVPGMSTQWLTHSGDLFSLYLDYTRPMGGTFSLEPVESQVNRLGPSGAASNWWPDHKARRQIPIRSQSRSQIVLHLGTFHHAIAGSSRHMSVPVPASTLPLPLHCGGAIGFRQSLKRTRDDGAAAQFQAVVVVVVQRPRLISQRRSSRQIVQNRERTARGVFVL